MRLQVVSLKLFAVIVHHRKRNVSVNYKEICPATYNNHYTASQKNSTHCKNFFIHTTFIYTCLSCTLLTDKNATDVLQVVNFAASCSNVLTNLLKAGWMQPVISRLTDFFPVFKPTCSTPTQITSFDSELATISLLTT